MKEITDDLAQRYLAVCEERDELRSEVITLEWSLSEATKAAGNPLNESGAGLDRLDSTRPYATDNVVPACWPCNYIKRRGAFTFDEMLRLGPILGPIWQVHQPRGTYHQTGTEQPI